MFPAKKRARGVMLERLDKRNIASKAHVGMRFVGYAFLIFVLLAGAWTALWFYAANQAGGGLDTWIAKEQAQGRKWTCPDRSTTGFPLALDVACTRPRFAGTVLGDPADGTLEGLSVHVSVFTPHHAQILLASPLSYRTDDGTTDLAMTWSHLALDVEGLPEAVSSGAIDMAALAVHGRVDGTDLQDSKAETGDITIVGVPGMTQAVDFTIALTGAGVPALDDFMGDKQPAALDIAGRLTKAEVVNAASTADLIEHWRVGGGTITFATARIARGLSQVEATGPLRLDDAHRLAGQLDATFIGLGPILRRYGINPNIATAGSILNGLFGGNKKTATDPNAIRLPIVFRGGRLGVGPIMTPIGLTPLY